MLLTSKGCKKVKCENEERQMAEQKEMVERRAQQNL